MMRDERIEDTLNSLKRLKWPVAALLTGLLGVVIRRWQLADAYDGPLALCDPLASPCWAMIAWYVLAAAVFTLLIFSDPPEGAPAGMGVPVWERIFSARGDRVYLTLMVAAGFLTLAAIPFLIREASWLLSLLRAGSGGDNPLMQVLLAVVAIPGGAGLLLSARASARPSGREDLTLMLPAFLCCVWLLESYRSNAADPVLWNYVPLMLAVACGMLFQLECAGLAFSKGHPCRLVWLACMTVAASAVAFAALPGAAVLLLLAGQTLAALAALWMTPERLLHPETCPADPEEPAFSEEPADDHQEEDTTDV